LPYDTTLGVSNEVEEGYDAAEISFQEGILLVIQSNDTK
jgi:thiamine pyrophosphokinase